MTIISFSKGTGALSTLTQLQKSEISRTTSISKISSSSKIRKASDAVADSAIGTKLKVEVESLKQLLIGTAQAKAALDIAEGGLNEITKALTRMNTLAMSAKNGIYKSDDVGKINLEFVNLIDEIDRIAKATNFNSKQLLSGTETVVTDSFENTQLSDNLRDGFLSRENQGIEGITIDNSKSNTAYKITYDQQTQLLKVSNLNDKTEFEERKVAVDKIKEGSLEELHFSRLGVTIKLNSNFDKGMSIGSEKDSMMDPKYHQDNIKNMELINVIDSDLIEDNPSIAGENPFKLKDGVTKFKIAGETDEFIIPTKFNEANTDTVTDLPAIKTALGIALPSGFKLSGDSATKANSGNGNLSTGDLSAINTSTTTQNLNITGISWSDAFKESGTDISVSDAENNDLSIGNFTSLTITGFNSDDGSVTFEVLSDLSITNASAETFSTRGTITGTFQLDKSTYDEGLQGIDYSTQSIEKDIDGKAKLLNREGTYELKPEDVVASDGFVYDASGAKVQSVAGDPNSTVQLKLINEKTNDIDVVRINGNLTDLNSFDIKMEGTNGKAKFYIDAAEGRLESEEFNLTDIDYNDGKDKTTSEYNAADDNSGYIAEKRLERGRIVLSRTISNGLREDSITIDLNKLKAGGLIAAKDLTGTGSPENLANASAGMEATDLAGTDPFEKSDNFSNDTLLTLNELKNTVVAYQDTSDKTELSFQVGTGSGSENSVNITIDSITAFRLQLINNTNNQKIQLSENQDELQRIIETISTAIDTVQTVRSEVAVGDNRLNVADSSIQTSITNSQAAVSAIFDLDIPSEMVELSQSEMMEQSSIEVLSKEMRAKQNLMKLF